MNSAQWINRVFRPAVMVAGIGPACYLAAGLTGKLSFDLGANPAETLEHFTGTTTLILVCVTLLVTPLRRLTGINPLIRLRKPIGLWAFFYACLHLTCYLWLDSVFDWSQILKDIVKRPYITLGFTAFLILLSLALTSSRWAVRKLGKNWQRLHRLIYLAAILGVIHYYWSVKHDVSIPLLFAGIVTVLLGARVIWWVSSRA